MEKAIILISDVPHVEPLSEDYMVRSIQFSFYDGDCKMNCNCEGTGIWKETVVAFLKVLPRHSAEDTDESLCYNMQ